MAYYWKAALLTVISVVTLLSGCGGPPIPENCRKAIRSHALVIQRMKASGRFADDLIKKHETQFMLLEALAELEKDQEAKLERCRKTYEVIGPQLELSENIAKIPESELEKSFWPPLGWNRLSTNQ